MASLQEGDTVETWAMVKHGYVELRFYINGRRISQSRFDDLYLPVSEYAGRETLIPVTEHEINQFMVLIVHCPNPWKNLSLS